MSTTMPDNPKSDYYNSSSARIIDEYKLTSNNCTTMVSDVLNNCLLYTSDAADEL